MTTPLFSLNSELLVARAQYWGWFVFAKIGLGLICMGVVSEGLRMFVPQAGLKIHRISGMTFLRNYEETHSLDIASMFSLMFVMFVFYLVSKMMKLWMPSDLIDREDLLWGSDREKLIITVVGCILISIDILLFYTAISRMRWGASILSLAGVIATVAYLCILILVSYVSLKLHARIQELKEMPPSDVDEAALEPFLEGDAA